MDLSGILSGQGLKSFLVDLVESKVEEIIAGGPAGTDIATVASKAYDVLDAVGHAIDGAKAMIAQVLAWVSPAQDDGTAAAADGSDAGAGAPASTSGAAGGATIEITTGGAPLKAARS